MEIRTMNQLIKKIHPRTFRVSFSRMFQGDFYLRRKAAFFGLFIIFMLIAQMLASAVMARAEDIIPDSGFDGIQKGMNELVSERDVVRESLNSSLESEMREHERAAENIRLLESEVYSVHTLPEVNERHISPTAKNAMIQTLAPEKPIYPRIFNLAEHSMVNVTNTLLETIIEGQDNYWIHTDYFPPEGGRISKWTTASFLPSINDPDQGMKLNQWNGVNVDNDTTTGDMDKSLFEWVAGSFPEGSDIYVRVTATIPVLDALTSGNILEMVQTLLDMINGTNLELSGGMKIEIRKDSYWSGISLPVDVGILRGIGYQDIEGNSIEYIWIGDFNFSDVPQFYEFDVMLGTISFYVGNTFSALYNFLLGLISGENVEANFSSFAPPYTVIVKMDKDGNNINADDRDSISSLGILVGYDKLQKEGERHRVVDRTWISANVTPAKELSVIPKNFHIKLHGEKNPITDRTHYNAIEWYSRMAANISAIYSEGKLNDTYILADVVKMPYGRLSSDNMEEDGYTSLRIRLDNMSTEENNFTRITVDSTQEIPEVNLYGFEYAYGYASGHQYNATMAHIYDIPTDILLEGSFVLKDAKDPFTVFNNASISFINGIVDNAMLALASTIYAVGIQLRSIPDALSDVTGKEGTILLEMSNKTSGERDYLGMAMLAVAYGHVDPTRYGKYATSSLSNHDYITTYIDRGITGVEDKVAIGLRISGVGRAYYSGEEDENGNLSAYHLELDTTRTFYHDPDTGALMEYAYDDPRLEIFYMNGDGDDISGDFARIAISDLPEHMELSFKDNVTTYDASNSMGDQNIDYLGYQSVLDGQYIELNITHIPPYLQFVNNKTIFRVSTIHFPDDASEEEREKPEYYSRSNEYFNLQFLITNESRNGEYIWREMAGNYVFVYRNNDMLAPNGSHGVGAISGRFNGLKSINYTTVPEEERAEVVIRIHNPSKNDLAVRLWDDTDYHDITSGLRGSAILGPIPEYLHMSFKRVKPKKNIIEPDTSNFSSLSDISVLMDSVKDFGRSIVDAVYSTITDTLKGFAMAESSEFWANFSTHDPVLGTKTNMDIIANISHGMPGEMYERHPEYTPAFWTYGINLRQEIMDKNEEKAIYDLRLYLTGLPSEGRIAWNTSGDYLYLEGSFVDFRPLSNQLVIDAKGIGTTDLLVRIDGIVSPMELNFLFDFTINATDGIMEGTLTADISSNGVPTELDELFAAIWSNASDYSRTRIYLPQVPSSVDLSLYLNSTLTLTYAGSDVMDYLMIDMKIGDISYFSSNPAYWTHGIVIRNGTDEDGNHVMDMRLYIEGVPLQAYLDVESEEDTTHIELELTEWAPAENWVYLDIMGIRGTETLLYLNGLSEADLHLTLDITAAETGEELIAHVRFIATKAFGGLYIKFRAYELDIPVLIQIYLPKLPDRLNADVQVKDGVYAHYTASIEIDHLFVRLMRFVDGAWAPLTLMAHELPTYLDAAITPNREFDITKSIILQGNPDIRFNASSNNLDIYLDMDGKITNGYGHTFIQVGDISNGTTITLTDPETYSISSPEGIGYAYLVFSRLPVMKNYYMDELYIFAEDIKSVDIHVKQLFGLYPVFKLTNAHGGRIHVKLRQHIGEGDNSIELKAAVLDVRYKTFPHLIPLFVNDISSSLGTNHYIIPEPITTVLASFIALLKGIRGVIVW